MPFLLGCIYKVQIIIIYHVQNLIEGVELRRFAKKIFCRSIVALEAHPSLPKKRILLVSSPNSRVNWIFSHFNKYGSVIDHSKKV